MAFLVKGRNTGFTCEQCGAVATPHASSVRNHCPACLWSKHVDDVSPGDRASNCGGLMKPAGLERGRRQGWRIVHCCTVCGEERPCAAAADDAVEAFLAISRKASLG